MLLRTWARLFRARTPERQPEAAPATVAASASASLSPPAAEALSAVGAALGRLSPQTADDFTARAPALVNQLGESAFTGVCQLLTLASGTRHGARLTDIIRETCQAAAALGRNERSAALLTAVAPLYAEHPLLGAAALRAPARYPELTAEAFADWLAAGRSRCGRDAAKLGSFLRLETTQARGWLESRLPGLPLQEVTPTLQHYLRALTGHPFRLETLASDPAGKEIGGRVARAGDAHRLALPRRVAVFTERDRNFLLYKLLAAQAAGRLLYDTHAPDAPPLIAAYEATRAFFADLGAGAGGLSHVDFAVIRDRAVERALPPRPASIAASDALALFPDAETAETLFDVIEMARVLRRMRSQYRGVERVATTLAEPLLASRRSLTGAPLTAAAVELLFRLALAGRVGSDLQAEYAALTDTLAAALSPCLTDDATVADSLRATLDIYRLLPPPAQRRWSPEAAPSGGAQSRLSASPGGGQPVAGAATQASAHPAADSPAERADNPSADNPSAGNASAAETDASAGALAGAAPATWDLLGARQYPEWDARLGDYRPDWCRVLDLGATSALSAPPPQADDAIVARLRSAFERWRPADFAWARPTTDGPELFLDALIERYVERRRQPWASDAVYAARRRTTRSVAALLLLDASRSTGEPLDGDGSGRPPRRVLDGEIESARCLAAALERLGDRFAVYAFNSRGRGAVRCFRLKAFGEPAGRLPPRLAALAPAANTRLGAAVRHATQLLLAEAARQRLLLVVTDGLPQDSDYGDVTYAVSDTAQALAEAQAVGVKPLGIALEAGQDAALLDALFGRGRYAHIGAAFQLPEALLQLYRRWAL